MKKIVLFTALLVVLFSCSSDENQNQSQNLKSLAKVNKSTDMVGEFFFLSGVTGIEVKQEAKNIVYSINIDTNK